MRPPVRVDRQPAARRGPGPLSAVAAFAAAAAEADRGRRQGVVEWEPLYVSGDAFARGFRVPGIGPSSLPEVVARYVRTAEYLALGS